MNAALCRHRLWAPADVDIQAAAHFTSVQVFLDQPTLRMGVTVFKECPTKCNSALSERSPAVALPFHWELTAEPSWRNMLGAKGVCGQRLQGQLGIEGRTSERGERRAER